MTRKTSIAIIAGTLTLALGVLAPSNATAQDTLFVAPDGNVGIGTASPTKRLTIQGAAGNTDIVRVVKSSGSSPIFRIFETTSGDGISSVYDNTGAEAVRLSAVGGGLVAIGCRTPLHDLDLGNAPGTECSVVGTRSYIDAGSTTFTASSSRTIKENLAPVLVLNILDKISGVKVYTYDFIDGPKDKIGLMAEDFHTIFSRGSDKVINGQDVEMALWLAVQQLTKELAELKALLAAERARKSS